MNIFIKYNTLNLNERESKIRYLENKTTHVWNLTIEYKSWPQPNERTKISFLRLFPIPKNKIKKTREF